MGKNTDPSPMEYVSRRMPNPRMERARLAREAEGMKAAELKEEAVRLGVPLGEAKTKEELVEAVQAATRS